MMSGILDQASDVRRRFLNSILWFFGIISFMGVAYPMGMFLWPPEVARKGVGKRTMKLPVAEAPIGDVKFVKFLRKPAIVIRPNEQELIVLSAVCTHLGCVVKWRESSRELVCPCHGGRFDIRGNVLGGPPPAPLPMFKTRIEHEYIVIEEV